MLPRVSTENRQRILRMRSFRDVQKMLAPSVVNEVRGTGHYLILPETCLPQGIARLLTATK